MNDLIPETLMPEKLKLCINKRSKLGSTGEIIKLAAPKTVQILYNALRIGPRLILRSAFELLRANTITRLLSALILISFDTINLLRKRISKKQYVINVVLAFMMLVGGTAGWLFGKEIIGVVVESAALAIIFGLVGAGIFGTALGMVWDRIIHRFWRNDSDEMLEILNQEFLLLCYKNGLSQQEAEITKLKVEAFLKEQFLKDMFIQENREAYAQSALLVYFEKEFDRNV